MESQFAKVAVKSEIEPGKMKAVKAGGKEILVANTCPASYVEELQKRLLNKTEVLLCLTNN